MANTTVVATGWLPMAVGQEMRAFADAQNIRPGNAPISTETVPDRSFNGVVMYKFGPTMASSAPRYFADTHPDISTMITTEALFLQGQSWREVDFAEAKGLVSGREVDTDEIAFLGAVGALLHIRIMRVVTQRERNLTSSWRIVEGLQVKSDTQEQKKLAEWDVTHPVLGTNIWRSLITQGVGQSVHEVRRRRVEKADHVERLRTDAVNAFLAYGWIPHILPIKPEDLYPSE
jgi:hypothetical protein